MHDHVLRVGSRRLLLGTRLDLPPATSAPGDVDLTAWDLPRQPLVARQVVESLDVLLEAVCLQLGAIDRRPLMQSMAATLSIAGREACLPLATLDFADPLRRELTAQAERIGETIATWAAEANESQVALRRHGREALTALALRSRCDGHLWTDAATSLLTGVHGGPVVMQLYNEWLHQLVLLRDALLAFENWQEVPLPLGRLDSSRGLRDLEAARASFLASFLTRIPTHASIVAHARSLFDPAGAGGSEGDLYGFQAEHGLALPSVVGSEVIDSASARLLTWHAARIDPQSDERPAASATVPFRYAFADYLAAPRSVIGATMMGAPPGAKATIVAEPAAGGGLHLWLQLGGVGDPHPVDLGQCLRGQRFAYRARAAGTARDGQEAPPRPDAIWHEAGAVLRQPGLVSADNGLHLVPTGGDPLLTLALLGKLYPENTVLAQDAAWPDVLAAGKGYGAKFIVGTPNADYRSIIRMPIQPRPERGHQ